MKRNYIQRLIGSLIVIVGVTIIAFLLLRLGGGDPARLMAGDTATEEMIQEYRIKMGLDQPLIVQYFSYMKNLFKGDLGYSWTYGMNVSSLLANRIPKTLLLGAIGLIGATIVSILLGIIAGVNQGKFIDFFAMFFAMFGQAMSPVWLGFLLILVFSVKLHWLPSQGFGNIKCIVLPALCIGFELAAQQTRLVRSGMVDILKEDFIIATRARGVKKFSVYTRYALRNALLPVVTNLGIQIGRLIAGATIVENIFDWPGMGQLLVQAVNTRDYQLVQSILLISAIMLVLGNIISDFLYTIIDPRISFN